MRKRIFRNMCLLSLVTVVVSFIMVFGVMYHEFDVRMQTELKTEAEYLSAGVETGGDEYLSSIEADPDISRVTLIALDGTVLFDSEVDQNTMENHLGRSEVQDALQFGKGHATRLSDTIGEQTYYYAQKLTDGTILRVASTTDSIYSSLLNCVPWLVVVGIVASFYLQCYLQDGKQRKLLFRLIILIWNIQTTMIFMTNSHPFWREFPNSTSRLQVMSKCSGKNRRS